MRRINFVILLLLLCTRTFAQDLIAACTKFNVLNSAIVNGTIPKQEAAIKFDALLKAINHYFPAIKPTTVTQTLWTFPLKGYNYATIGGVKGDGYADNGYHYLDGNKHAAHPAHDIFIFDRNQDALDDRTRQPVNVLAVADGIVVACENQWQPGSPLRGGKYIWLYHPAKNIFTYYAHNRAIFVSPGDVVKQGRKIAEVGRTGFNAYPKRSPTHLHFSAFHIVNGLPVPYNCYAQLKSALKS